jgi:hypothetical protein
LLRVGLLRTPRVRVELDVGRRLTDRNRAIERLRDELAFFDRHFHGNAHDAARRVADISSYLDKKK